MNLPSTDWDDFYTSWRWRQGEHVTLLAPTGQGKTTLGKAILDKRDYVLVFANKAEDSTMRALVKDGFTLAREWPPPPDAKRVVLWPDIRRKADAIARQREVFRQALVSVYRRGGWCVFIDELLYVTEYLGLTPLVELLWLQGRSLGVSLVTAAQRPANVPVYAYDQASHLFLWRDNDRRNLDRFAEIAGQNDAAEIRRVVGGLQGHDVLYVGARDGTLAVTRAPR